MHSTVQSNAWTMVSQWKLRKLQSYLAIIVKLIWLRPLRARTETQISSSLRVTAVSASTSHNFCEACVRVVSTAAQIKVDFFFLRNTWGYCENGAFFTAHSSLDLDRTIRIKLWMWTNTVRRSDSHPACTSPSWRLKRRTAVTHA